MLPLAGLSYYNYFTTEIGYFVACVDLYIGLSISDFASNIWFNLGFGTIVALLASIEDSINDLHQFKIRAKNHKTRSETLNVVCEFVRLHAILKQFRFISLNWFSHRFVRASSLIYEPIGIVICVWSMATMCSTPLMVEIALDMMRYFSYKFF